MKAAGKLWIIITTVCLPLALFICLTPVASAATQELLFNAPEDRNPGAEAGRLQFPWGTAANPNLPGDIYVTGNNDRIDEFTPWGEFVKAFGWNVNAGAPEEKLQTCTAASGCQKGSVGAGQGQFDSPEGVGFDAEGNLYVIESGNHRVQKFDSEGNFLLAFGTQGTGPGQFNGGFASYVGRLAVSPIDDTVFVGEGKRIQEFSSGGVYVGEITVPNNVSSLTVSQDGLLYLTLTGGGEEKVVRTLDPSTGEFLPLDFVAESSVKAVAVDKDNHLFAVTGPNLNGSGQLLVAERVTEFDATGKCLNCGAAGEGEEPGFDRVEDGSVIWGIGSGSACGPSDIYVAHFANGSGSVPLKSYLNAFGPPPAPAVCPPPVRPPDITEQYAASVGTDGAALRAGINPRFWQDTVFYVEYGSAPCSEGGCKIQPLPPGSKLISAVVNTALTASVPISDLAPATTYHYRFVAQSSGGGPVRGVGGVVGTDGAEGTFSTFPLSAAKGGCVNQARRGGASAMLTDCRAYEMVSPVDKENGEIIVQPSGDRGFPTELQQSALAGGKLTYSSNRAFGDAQSAPFSSQYLAQRDEGREEWTSQAISPPRVGATLSFGNELDVQFKAFSEDLCSGWLFHEAEPVLGEGGVAGFPNLYHRSNCGPDQGIYQAITTVEPPNAPEEYAPELQGFATEASLAVFRAKDKLTSDASGTKVSGEPIVQLYGFSDGKIRVISVLPSGAATSNSSAAGAGGSGWRHDSLEHAVSADASRVYWTALTNSSPGPIYVRENPMQPQSKLTGGECTQPERACTLPVSASVPGSDKTDAAQYWMASPDGARAIFSFIGGPLGQNLYEYDAESGTSTLIAEKVSGVLGASEDATRIYLASSKVLAPGAEAGAVNIYLYQAAQGIIPQSFKLVTTLTHPEVSTAQGGGIYCNPTSRDPFKRCSRVNADGSRLVFMSTERLTGYDNIDVLNRHDDAEVYLYDSTANGGEGRLNCISCNPSGERPTGREFGGEGGDGRHFLGIAARIPSWESSFYAPRALSDDGSRLFFESFDALLLRDTNGKADVYEWEAASSAKECAEKGAELFVPSAAGCISLISTGQSANDSQFADASATGDDVFFKTAESLAPQDPGQIDIYDARAGGGFLPKPPPTPPCEGEACQPTPTPPGVATPGSSSYRGPGNPKIRKAKKGCPKGKHGVRRAGKARCVAKGKKQTGPKQARVGSKGARR